MASIENGDKLIAVHSEYPSVAAWILADGSRFISDEGDGAQDGDEGFDESRDEIVADE